MEYQYTTNGYNQPQILLTLAILEDWDIESLDVKIIYLYGELDEEIHPPRLPISSWINQKGIKKGQERKVCHLLKSLYRLKQTALQWNKELHRSLLTLGFICTRSDAGVYFKFDKTDITIVIIYVYDVLFMGSNPKLVKKEKGKFMKVWESRDLGETKEYLGMRITRDRKETDINPGPMCLCGKSP